MLLVMANVAIGIYFELYSIKLIEHLIAVVGEIYGYGITR